MHKVKLMKKVLLIVAGVGTLAFVVHEIPALRRELRILGM